MTYITQILSQAAAGDSHAADQLLPLVYDELRQLATQRLAREQPGQTLQATALVHEAYLRLVGRDRTDEAWQSHGHFFAAAAEAMRRIVIENARRKRGPKQGGDQRRVEIDPDLVVIGHQDFAASMLDVLALDEALTRLSQVAPDHARLVELRFFGGLMMSEAASVLGISRATAARQWAYARAWLFAELNDSTRDESPTDQRLRDTTNP